jgi:putative selenate reductase
MNKVMKTTSIGALLGRMAGERQKKDSIYEIPGSVSRELFEIEPDSPGMAVMSGKASFPIGPAAGPNSQIAPNIVAAYLSGARVFELKTVQKNDRLEIEKPCIDALDEGHNVEWSTELSLEEARREYLNAWIVVNILSHSFSRKPGDFFFNASVGYTLEGIQSESVDSFIEGMRRPEATTYWSKALEELDSFLASGKFEKAFGEAAAEKARTLAAHVPVRPVHSITLSTMHGCPPEEIAKIGRYLLEEKGFDTYIKLNPTLLGYDTVRSILDTLGWERIVLKRESFEHDLQMDAALGLIKELGAAAHAKGRRFGIKLSNTLANANVDSRLPGAERYMSGRALFPITVRLASSLAKALPDFGSRFSYCGGVSALNAKDLIKAGVGPLTIATDILKPGGYLRMAQIAKDVADALPFAPDTADADALESLAESALSRPEYREDWKGGTVSISKKLPLFDCFAAPCIEACPVGQKVPAYVKDEGEGLHDQALAAILADNPLAHITGVLCDHVCQEHCSRLDYEGSVRIRDVKHAATRGDSLETKPLPVIACHPQGKTAVLGAGPAGLACAYHLALAGQEVVVFDSAKEPGGVPANVIPRFRIERSEIESDVERIRNLGVGFEFGVKIDSMDMLKAQGFTSFFLGIGASSAKDAAIAGEGVRRLHALDFLARFSCEGPDAFKGHRHVIVMGGGNTACDAVRAASRIPGVETVHLSYRRTKREMPADKEELANALKEATSFLELSLPEALEPGKARLRRMSLGPKDSSGRRKPLPSDETFELPCDLVIGAIGEEPDRAALEAFQVGFSENGLPRVDPETLETDVPDLYLGGDALRGPASIIAAESDGRRAARAILAKAGISFPSSDYSAPPMDKAIIARRGEILASLTPEDPGFAAREAQRCLACDSACLRCVEVCPNRANMFIEMGSPFSQSAQILHVDRLCNECGNCGFFCPYQGEPFAGKPTLFDDTEELDHSKNSGFTFSFDQDLPGLYLRAQVGGKAFYLDYSAWNGTASQIELAPMIALAREVYRNHPYLVEDMK